MADQAHRGGLGGMLGGMGERAQEKVAAGLIMGVLRGLHYPLGREDLARTAQDGGAPGALMDLLARMPDRQYTSADDVAREGWKAWKSR